MRALLLLALLALPAAAQTTGSVFIGLGNYEDLGFRVPLYLVGGSIEHETPHFIFALSADWSPTDKYRGARLLIPGIAPEWSLTAHPSAYVRLGPVLVGGGAGYSITRTSEYTKDGIRWNVAGGVDFPIENKRLRVLGSHVFSGTDRSNDLEGNAVSMRFDFPLAKLTTRVGFEVGFWNLHASNQADGPTVHARTWLLTLGAVL